MIGYITLSIAIFGMFYIAYTAYKAAKDYGTDKEKRKNINRRKK